MFIVLLKLSDKSRASEFMAAHKAWIARGFDDGVFLAVGNLEPGPGGAIIAHQTSRASLDARVNLAVQTRIIAGARMFVGTCGSLAWLAPLLGVRTVPVFTDASFLHAHLHLARRVYGRLDGGAFSPVDLSGLVDAGLAIGRAAPTPVGRLS